MLLQVGISRLHWKSKSLSSGEKNHKHVMKNVFIVFKNVTFKNGDFNEHCLIENGLK